MTNHIAITTHTRLTHHELAEVEVLAAEIRGAGIDPRLNLEWLSARDDTRPSDWLARANGRLVGIMATERFGDTAETTIAVLPGAPESVADALFAVLVAQMPEQGMRRILLLHDRAAEQLRRLAEVNGLNHDHAELVMRRPGNLPVPEAATGTLVVRRAEGDDLALAARVFVADWGGEVDDVVARARVSVERGVAYYVALLDGEPIAALNLQRIEDRPWVYGFSVTKPYRGQGFGRQVLAAVLADALAADSGDVFLEVEPTNTPAVRLYQSLGFAPLRTFDYWAKELVDDQHS